MLKQSIKKVLNEQYREKHFKLFADLISKDLKKDTKGRFIYFLGKYSSENLIIVDGDIAYCYTNQLNRILNRHFEFSLEDFKANVEDIVKYILKLYDINVSTVEDVFDNLKKNNNLNVLLPVIFDKLNNVFTGHINYYLLGNDTIFMVEYDTVYILEDNLYNKIGKSLDISYKDFEIIAERIVELLLNELNISYKQIKVIE